MKAKDRPARESGRTNHLADRPVLLQACVCAWNSFGLLRQGRLHLGYKRIGAAVRLPNGQEFVVFRESSCDGEAGPAPVTLAVWFHLRGVPERSRLRRYLFERACLVNTILFAGFAGYRVKLWMVDPQTADYAGLYSWRSAEEAEEYARYIVRILSPLSRSGTVGYQVLRNTPFEVYLAGTAMPSVGMR
jgi:hypothetical protein